MNLSSRKHWDHWAIFNQPALFFCKVTTLWPACLDMTCPLMSVKTLIQVFPQPFAAWTWGLWDYPSDWVCPASCANPGCPS